MPLSTRSIFFALAPILGVGCGAADSLPPPAPEPPPDMARVREIQFTATQEFSSHGSLTMALGDVNGDGKLDLAIVEWNSGNTFIRLGDGAGHFTQMASYVMPAHTSLCRLDDLDGDKKLDLLLAHWPINNGIATTFSVFAGKGDGTFDAQRASEPHDYITGFAVGDFNGDGAPDLAALQDYRVINHRPPLSPAIFLLTNRGDGTFKETILDEGAAGPVLGLGAWDVNRDGKDDLITITESEQLFTTVADVWFADGNGLSRSARYPFGRVTEDADLISAADLNGDGFSDAILPVVFGDIDVLLGTPNGGYGPPIATTHDCGTLQFSTADFDHDGRLDLALFCENGVEIRRGNGTGSFAEPLRLPVPNAWGPVGDLDGDGYPDFVLEHEPDVNGPVTVTVYLNK